MQNSICIQVFYGYLCCMDSLTEPFLRVGYILYEAGGDCVSGSTIGPTVGEELKKCAYSWIEQRKRFYSLDHKYIDIAEKGQEKELKQGLTEKGVLDDDDEFDAELERALELS